MALTKTQINYLENKLNRVAEDKIRELSKELGDYKGREETIINELIAGKIKLLSSSEIINKLEIKFKSNSYYRSLLLDVCEMISDNDKKRVEDEINERQNKLNELRDKVCKIEQNALDKIVLDGVDVETAIAELNNIK